MALFILCQIIPLIQVSDGDLLPNKLIVLIWLKIKIILFFPPESTFDKIDANFQIYICHVAHCKMFA